MATEDDVQQASDRFYGALNSMINGDAAPMVETDVWSHGSDVSTMHPIGDREVGWEAVKGPWQQVAGMASGGQVAIEDSKIIAVGDLAYETGTESGSGTLAGQTIAFQQRVTNVYRRQNGEWRIVHHHTDKSPAMEELVRRLQAN